MKMVTNSYIFMYVKLYHITPNTSNLANDHIQSLFYIIKIINIASVKDAEASKLLTARNAFIFLD